MQTRTSMLILILTIASLTTARAAGPTAESEPFGRTPDGKDVRVYTLRNANNLQAKVINYGAMLISLQVPDRNGKLDDVALGFDTLEEYLNRNFGGTTGRFANRIENAKFAIDGVEYKITPNAGTNHIHGGRNGFSKVLWKASPFFGSEHAGVRLDYLSKDGEEGYPGNLECTVVYTLTNDNELKIEYAAVTDKPTVINLTNHGYYNLAGAGNGDVHNHLMHIFASNYTVPDKSLIPTGEIAPVKGTPLDFTQPKKIGDRIEELTQTRGYDHNYVFDNWDGSLALRVRVYEPTSGRVMELSTTEPGVQLYTANHVKDQKARDGKIYNQHGGFCLETQHYPDSPNKPNFPTTILFPHETFRSVTTHKFSTR